MTTHNQQETNQHKVQKIDKDQSSLESQVEIERDSLIEENLDLARVHTQNDLYNVKYKTYE